MDHRPLTPGVTKMVGLEPICLGAAELGSYRSGSTLPGLLPSQNTFLEDQLDCTLKCLSLKDIQFPLE